METRLLNCNLNNVKFDNVGSSIIQNLLRKFDASCDDYTNYHSKMQLEKWALRHTVGGEDLGDNINHAKFDPRLRELFNIILNLKPTTILDAGAGGGTNTKVLYSLFEQHDLPCKFYCVENHPNHYNQILDNFHNHYNTIKPFIKLDENKVQVFHAPIHKTPLENGSVELVFSHATIAHIPFVPAIKTLKKLSELTSKYILHLEHDNTKLNIQINNKDKHNNYCIDYRKFYETLGFKTLIHKTLPLDNQTMTLYLGEK